ncbi:MAG: hypothetical protein KDM63_10735 [Verrucomicrobiae bacterium]|nr:hypothetical protein [Verrucomicrobiae bacterium]
MRSKPLLRSSAALAAAILGSAISSPAAGPKGEMANPDFTRGEPIPEGATHDWNLGPTGARGWIYTNKLETTEARQVFVTQVEKGSPADGSLEKGDVILRRRGCPIQL